jgi:hypothetical protein
LHIERQPLLFRHAKHEQADGVGNRKALLWSQCGPKMPS